MFKTLRDEFAMAALTGLLSDSVSIAAMSELADDRKICRVGAISIVAYEYAEAMIKERKRHLTPTERSQDGWTVEGDDHV